VKPKFCGLSLLLAVLFAWAALAPHHAHVDIPRPAAVTSR
jgi:hypothetical protein